MKMIPKEDGNWVKDGIRYHLVLTTETTRPEAAQAALSAGYTFDVRSRLDFGRLAKKKELYKEFLADTDNTAVVAGRLLTTNVEFRLNILYEKMKADADAGYICTDFVFADGKTEDLNATQIIAMFNAVESAVTNRRGRLADRNAQVDAATTAEEIQSVKW